MPAHGSSTRALVVALVDIFRGQLELAEGPGLHFEESLRGPHRCDEPVEVLGMELSMRSDAKIPFQSAAGDLAESKATLTAFFR